MYELAKFARLAKRLEVEAVVAKIFVLVLFVIVAFVASKFVNTAERAERSEEKKFVVVALSIEALVANRFVAVAFVKVELTAFKLSVTVVEAYKIVTVLVADELLPITNAAKFKFVPFNVPTAKLVIVALVNTALDAVTDVTLAFPPVCI